MSTITLPGPRSEEGLAGHRTVTVRRSRKGWLLKACRRCGGDMVLQADELGMTDYTCIQCGAVQPSIASDQGGRWQAQRRPA